MTTFFAKENWCHNSVPPEKYYGLKIISAIHDIGNDRILLGFEGGKTIKIEDYGQSCCEHRYLTCDDSLEDLVEHPDSIVVSEERILGALAVMREARKAIEEAKI